MPRKTPQNRNPLGYRRNAQTDRVAANYAEHAIDAARDATGLTLDFSEASIDDVDRLLTRTRDAAETSKPDEGKVGLFAMMFGFYVGEVFRRHHGGKWGMAREVLSPAIKDQHGNVHAPLVAARDHLAGEGSIAEYYRRITTTA